MNKVFIIAEAGVNHNGKLELAKKLVDVASEAGADAVKFQTFRAKKIVCKGARKAAYQIKNTGATESQYQMLEKLELTEGMHRELQKYCDEKGIQFLSTPFDIESIQMLAEMNMPILKIPSGEITNYPYLCSIAKCKKKIILSTGMSNLDEVRTALEILRKNGAKDITALHCNTQYPTIMSDVNLMAMVKMREELGISVGYSDHTLGIEVPIAAVALGATVIEKHFTLDKKMEGPDHKASLEPHELKQMVDGIRCIEQALGDGVKQPSKSENSNRQVIRKSIVAAKKIKKGELLTEENLTTKRPGTGINPMKWNEVVGKKAERDYEEDEMIQI